MPARRGKHASPSDQRLPAFTSRTGGGAKAPVAAATGNNGRAQPTKAKRQRSCRWRYRVHTAQKAQFVIPGTPYLTPPCLVSAGEGATVSPASPPERPGPPGRWAAKERSPSIRQQPIREATPLRGATVPREATVLCTAAARHWPSACRSTSSSAARRRRRRRRWPRARASLCLIHMLICYPSKGSRPRGTTPASHPPRRGP